jgi:altronate hydrolase
MKNKVLKVHPSDNLIVALQPLEKLEEVVLDGVKYILPNAIEAKHKFVTHDLSIGDTVTMYGVRVGKSIQKIKKGEQITTFNLKHESEEFSIKNRVPKNDWLSPDISKWKNRTFLGYHRSDGQIGTANYWLVIPLVFCENRNILKLKDAFDKALGYAFPDVYLRQVQDFVKLEESGNFEEFYNYNPSQPSISTDNQRIFSNIDGIKFLTHEMGCGGANSDSERLAALFAAYANNANVAGITVLSLGCQKTQLSDLMEAIKSRNSSFDKTLLYYDQQTFGTEFEMLSAAIKETFKELIEVNKLTRKPAQLSHLNIGLKRGGSDGFSGISANPVLGHLSDLVVALGGRTYLAEFPELCGVEQELINRCVSEEKAQKFETLMRNYAELAKNLGESFDMNPSFGNIKDGLITDAIKSAGAAKKGGTAPIVDVLDYAETAKVAGLHLVCTPGNDVLATTGKAAAGATIILFTTGLGTPTGNPICPVVKVSTNTKLANKMPDIIDFDCGAIIEGEKTIEQTAEELLEYCIDLASGKFQTKAQILGQDDFIPWQKGINL